RAGRRKLGAMSRSQRPNGPAPETLPARWYHDPAVYARERQAIFRRHWWPLAREDRLAAAGAYATGEIAGWPAFVIRGKDGALRGFHNVCRHRAGPLLRDGAGRCAALTCRYHGWRYDLMGALKSAPGLTLGADLDPAEYSLHPLRAESWNGLVFACLDADAPGLAAWLGDIVAIAEGFPAVADMTYQGEIAKEGATNWKAYGDNSCEGYHVKLVHSGLGKTVPDEQVEIRPYENGAFVGFDVTYAPSAADPSRRGRGFWVYKFPGLLLHFSDYAFNLEVVNPTGPRSVMLRRWFWCAEDLAKERGTTARAAIDSAEQVMGEDLEICELVQKNLEAGVYQSGRLSPTEEVGTIYFQRLVREALEGPGG
ncbi:MAG: aromatic ring-hydroxylating dioxygenase subunit alpha, partial [Kiloniellales bacterium]|nr:aromatic ring-hydroxylating dioxygenase subunit alpha [Kiloniellales bacterium]